MMTIAIDFDGTCVTNEYPSIGKEVPNCVKVLKILNKNDVGIILLTQRDGYYLEAAKEWFSDRGIKLYGVNENPDQKSWNRSRKVYADFYIDDHAIGCPLTLDDNLSDRYFVDWKSIETTLRKVGIK